MSTYLWQDYPSFPRLRNQDLSQELPCCKIIRVSQTKQEWRQICGHLLHGSEKLNNTVSVLLNEE